MEHFSVEPAVLKYLASLVMTDFVSAPDKLKIAEEVLTIDVPDHKSLSVFLYNVAARFNSENSLQAILDQVYAKAYSLLFDSDLKVVSNVCQTLAYKLAHMPVEQFETTLIETLIQSVILPESCSIQNCGTKLETQLDEQAQATR